MILVHTFVIRGSSCRPMNKDETHCDWLQKRICHFTALQIAAINKFIIIEWFGLGIFLYI